MRQQHSGRFSGSEESFDKEVDWREILAATTVEELSFSEFLAALQQRGAIHG